MSAMLNWYKRDQTLYHCCAPSLFVLDGLADHNNDEIGDMISLASSTRQVFSLVRGAPDVGRRAIGGIGRMLDMGGAPSAATGKNTSRINASKNCKLQAICFDFSILTNGISESEQSQHSSEAAVMRESPRIATSATLKPNVSMVQQVADLLNVDLGGSGIKKPQKRKDDEDDLSLLTGEKNKGENSKEGGKNRFSDIRSKYADKLAKRGVQGGLAGVELAKHQVEETLKRGDAGGHLAARAMAAANPVSRTKSWMALSGTGYLLQYLTQRSIKIALLPKPDVPKIDEEEGERMEDFSHQLHDVSFDFLIKDGTHSASHIVDTSLQKLGLDPNLVLLVSDRDDYLRAAKDAGMLTCRIMPLNGRRGNISVHFVVQSVPEVQDVVNEINGISFNAIFKHGKNY